MEEFFQMGGYSKFVWPAYMIVALVLFGLWIWSQRFQRTSEDELIALNPRERGARRETRNEA